MHTLYYVPGACSLACHIALREAGLHFELARTDFGPEFLKVNPKGLVPALRTDTGIVLTEVPAILMYVADQAAPQLGMTARPRSITHYRTLEWLAYIASELHKGYGNPRHSDETQGAVQTRLRQRFDRVETVLATQSWLVEDRYSVADMYLFTVLRWSALVGLPLAQWPALEEHSRRVAARPAVKAALLAEGIERA